jgi:SET domain-containing protein
MVGLLVCQSEINNRGIFATRDFKKNEPITTLRGRLVTYQKLKTNSGIIEEAYYSETNKQVPPYFRRFEAHYIQIGKNLYVEPLEYDFFINHSCDPNSGYKIIGKKGILIAIKPIKKGEEIVCDYSTTMYKDGWEMDCTCGRRNCRGRIRDFNYIPKKLQQRYIQLGIVPRYNIS